MIRAPEWYNVLVYFTIATPVLPMVASITKRNGLNKPFLMLVIYIWLGVVFDLLGLLFMKNKIPTAYSNNIYTLFQFSFLSWFFYLVNTKVKMRRMITSLGGFTLVFMLYNLLFFQGLGYRNSYSWAVAALILLFFSLLTLRSLGQDPTLDSMQRNPVFWVSTGVLIYFSGNFFLFLFDHMADATVKMQFPFYTLHHPLRIILNSLYFLAILCLPTRSSTSS